ncbi:hypothetical protein P154DRAFT_33956 [Amniculicola lignicola CBS 123094]|uniref:Uncharacterized protein n=1 Tax=Amniculicola lignicola CBS 123094 TaxID=1392246 RepID=A0A6A5WUE0_9PLEO|nr:hypothetical protein P154DRAFT_33956 [Amniculicola lignicola CBS 123094]
MQHHARSIVIQAPVPRALLATLGICTTTVTVLRASRRDTNYRWLGHRVLRAEINALSYRLVSAMGWPSIVDWGVTASPMILAPSFWIR